MSPILIIFALITSWRVINAGKVKTKNKGEEYRYNRSHTGWQWHSTCYKSKLTVKQEVKMEVEQKPKNLDLLHGLLERRKNQEQKSEIKKEEKTEIDDILGKSLMGLLSSDYL